MIFFSINTTLLIAQLVVKLMIIPKSSNVANLLNFQISPYK